MISPELSTIVLAVFLEGPKPTVNFGAFNDYDPSLEGLDSSLKKFPVARKSQRILNERGERWDSLNVDSQLTVCSHLTDNVDRTWLVRSRWNYIMPLTSHSLHCCQRDLVEQISPSPDKAEIGL